MRVKGKEAGRVVNTWSTREMLARSVKQLLVPVNCHAVRLCSGGKDHLGDGEMHLVQRQLFLSGVRFLKHVDPEKLKENARNRGIALDVDKMVRVYQEYSALFKEIVPYRTRRNELTRTVAETKDETERTRLIQEGLDLKKKITQTEAEWKEKKDELMSEILKIPNIPHSDVPVGGAEQSRLVSEHGSKPEFSYKAHNHLQIGKRLGLFEFQAASNASGHGYYYLKGAAALLELGLIQYAMQKAISRGFQPVITPDVVKDITVIGCGFQPRGAHGHVYQLDPSIHGHACLSGTAEIPLAGLYMNNLFNLKDLPIKMVAFGRCYRAEAGGKTAKNAGLYRVHQFSKVELFGLTANETGAESDALLEEILDLQKEICTELGFHYRVLDMATEELGAPAYRKYDIEAWMPGSGIYGEVTSASNCTDYQSYRMKIMYPNPAKRTDSRQMAHKPVHTVNGTCCAVPRVIVTLLETHQQPDGSILVPTVLQPFLGERIA